MDVSGGILQALMPAVHAGHDEDLHFYVLQASVSNEIRRDEYYFT
jgi:hypothetical protein